MDKYLFDNSKVIEQKKSKIQELQNISKDNSFLSSHMQTRAMLKSQGFSRGKFGSRMHSRENKRMNSRQHSPINTFR